MPRLSTFDARRAVRVDDPSTSMALRSKIRMSPDREILDALAHAEVLDDLRVLRGHDSPLVRGGGYHLRRGLFLTRECFRHMLCTQSMCRKHSSVQPALALWTCIDIIAIIH